MSLIPNSKNSGITTKTKVELGAVEYYSYTTSELEGITPTEGLTVYDSTLRILKTWNGNTWVGSGLSDDSIYVQDYVLNPDTSFDSSNQIQQAINDAIDQNKKLVFPNGKLYRVDTKLIALRDSSKPVFVIEGNNSTIFPNCPTAGLQIAPETAFPYQQTVLQASITLLEDGVTNISTNIAAGTYNVYTYIAAWKTAVELISAKTYTLTYNSVNNKVTISVSSGTFIAYSGSTTANYKLGFTIDTSNGATSTSNSSTIFVGGADISHFEIHNLHFDGYFSKTNVTYDVTESLLFEEDNNRTYIQVDIAPGTYSISSLISAVKIGMDNQSASLGLGRTYTVVHNSGPNTVTITSSSGTLTIYYAIQFTPGGDTNYYRVSKDLGFAVNSNDTNPVTSITTTVFGGGTRALQIGRDGYSLDDFGYSVVKDCKTINFTLYSPYLIAGTLTRHIEFVNIVHRDNGFEIQSIQDYGFVGDMTFTGCDSQYKSGGVAGLILNVGGGSQLSQARGIRFNDSVWYGGNVSLSCATNGQLADIWFNDCAADQMISGTNAFDIQASGGQINQVFFNNLYAVAADSAILNVLMSGASVAASNAITLRGGNINQITSTAIVCEAIEGLIIDGVNFSSCSGAYCVELKNCIGAKVVNCYHNNLNSLQPINLIRLDSACIDSCISNNNGECSSGTLISDASTSVRKSITNNRANGVLESEIVNTTVKHIGTTAGIVFNNMTTTERQALTQQAGLVVYDTTLGQLCMSNGTDWYAFTTGGALP